MRPADRESLIVAPDADALLSAVAAFTPPQRKYDTSSEAALNEIGGLGPARAAGA